MREILIDGRAIGPGHPPFTVAEAGINHNGDLDRALEMVRVAKAAGADAVKFQTFKASEFVGDPQQQFTYRSQGKQVTESMLAMFQRYELPEYAWHQIKAECVREGITFLSTPQNRSDLDVLLEVGIPAIKIGSDDFTNLPLIRSYAQTTLPLILSCGMSDLAEVHQALQAAGWFGGGPVMLLLCTSEYPTPPADVNILKLTTLQQAFPGLVVGFSDHTQGATAAALAAALGARLFEKHFTLDHELPGPDHWFSEGPAGLAAWVRTIHEAVTMIGNPLVEPTPAELSMRVLARRSIVALRDIQPGERLDDGSIGLRRPGGGLPPSMFEQVLGLTACRAIKRGQQITLKDAIS